MVTYTGGKEGDRLVDTAERGDIDGLATDGSLGTDTGGVLTGTGVDNGVNENLSKHTFHVKIGFKGSISRICEPGWGSGR